MAEPDRKEGLVAELGAARAEFEGFIHGLRRDFAVNDKLKYAVRRNPAAWFAGAGVLGLLLSKLPPAQRKVTVKGSAFRKYQTEQVAKATFGLALLKIILSFVKPALVLWVKSRLTGRRSQRI
jgi:hypothetical protein